MRFQIIGFTLGVLLVILGFAQAIPGFADWAAGEGNAGAFFANSLLCLFTGGILFLANRGFEKKIRVRDAFLLTTFSWLAMGFFSAIPFYMSDLRPSFTDAFFEAISGITTTGSTVFAGLDNMSPGILLWRSMTQWIGGMGIVAFAIVFLPYLQIGGMQLFRTESSDRSEKLLPRTQDMVLALFKVYCGLTVLCGVAYYLCGMSGFDALNHAMTTIPTGGFSTHDSSFGHFSGAAIPLAGTVFMLLGGLPFVLYIKLIFQGRVAFLEDVQFRTVMAMLIVFIGLLSVWLTFTSDYGAGYSLLHVAFNVTSVLTTSGFASTDYMLWGPFATMIFFVLTYLGTCAGSTSGGLKAMRLVIASKALSWQVKTLLYPHGVFAMRYQNQPLEHPVVMTVLGFLGMYVSANVLLTLGLSATGLDFATAISGAATAISNTGPGIGSVIGPAGNFYSLPDAAKWLLSAGMLLGRLEILTVMVLFTYEYWNE